MNGDDPVLFSAHGTRRGPAHAIFPAAFADGGAVTVGIDPDANDMSLDGGRIFGARPLEKPGHESAKRVERKHAGVAGHARRHSTGPVKTALTT
jgi:hypothetical protein